MHMDDAEKQGIEFFNKFPVELSENKWCHSHRIVFGASLGRLFIAQTQYFCDG